MDSADLFESLNEQQRDAVFHVEGPLLTLAGPGSGKTRVVTHRIAHLVQTGISPFQILALTFTNKAAAEMRRRLEGMIGQTPIWMGTFHGYCARFLREHGQAVGIPQNYSIYDPSDAKSAMKVAIEKTNVELTHLNIDSIIREISNQKNRLVTPDSLTASARTALEHVIATVYPAYQQELLKNAAVDFDDLLLHSAVILRDNPELRASMDAKHRFVLVDEYQDTNFAQYVIMRALAVDHPNLNVTGDPDQSIYGWRGANINNILNFEKDFPATKIVRLEENYRSSPEILSIADQLIANNIQRKEKRLIPTQPSAARVRLTVYLSDRDEANQIANRIAEMIGAGEATPGDFAILYRTNAHSRLFEQALAVRGLAYQMIGGFRFYQRQEIKDLLAYLMLLCNPADDVAFARVINTPPRGIGPKTLNEIKRLAQAREVSLRTGLQLALQMGLLSAKASKNARHFLELFDTLGELSIGSVAELIRYLLKETNYVEYLTRKRSEEVDGSVSENIDELLADAAQVDRMFPEGDGLENFLEQVALISDTDQWDPNCERVTMMTMHSAKGLEFKHVFIVAVEENVLPHIRSKDTSSQIEEERRLFFVAITRAERNLDISLAQRRGFNQSRLAAPSSFLMEIPSSEFEINDHTNRFRMAASSFDNDWECDWDQGYDSVSGGGGQRALSGRASGDTDSGDSDDFEPSVADSFDSETQLPQDELASLLQEMKKKKQSTGTLGRVRAASDLLSPTSSQSELEVGSIVAHPSYGRGKITAIDGRGLKRTCKIKFDDLPHTKSFHLHHAKITLVDE